MKTDDSLARLGHQLREELRRSAGPPPQASRLRRRRIHRRVARALATLAMVTGGVVAAPQFLPGTELTIDPAGPPAQAPPDAPPSPTPEVTSFALPTEVPMQILAVRFNDPSRAIIDLEDGEATTYPPGSTHLPADAIAGAAILDDGATAIWQDGTVRTFAEGAEEPSLVHTPAELINPPEAAPSLRVIPTADGEAIWVVQIGSCCPRQVEGRAELIDLETGRVTLTAALPPNSLPIAAITGGGLLLNTRSVVDTGDGWVDEPGSHEWLLLTAEGTVSPRGRGEVLGATGETALVLSCESHEPRHGCALDLVDLDSRERRGVEPPVDGEWTSVTQPNVPGDSPAWDAATPDGRVLLAITERDGLEQEPSVSYLIAVDTRTGDASVLRQNDGPPPPAGWDRTGRYVAMVDGNDLHVLDTSDGNEVTLTDVIPTDHYVTSMR